MPRGYDRALYILPFNHRGSFQTKMFGWKSPLSEAADSPGGAKRRRASKRSPRSPSRYHDFVDLFERASHLSSELSEHTRSGHYPSKEA